MSTAASTKTESQPLVVRHLGVRDYLPVWQAMQNFTDERDQDCADEIWLVEHNPVFTQGQAGRQEHLLCPGDIPVVKADRGGQITYHGPGQAVLYVLFNLRRLKIGVRELVTWLEQSIIDWLSENGISAYAKSDAPGVYVEEKKIASLGLRVRRGCSFHGLALNVDMDLSPFKRINPCGYAGMEMVQCSDLNNTLNLKLAQQGLVKHLAARHQTNQVLEQVGFENE